MSELPKCEYMDPARLEACGQQVLMPTQRPADVSFGPYLCSEHTERINADREEIRAHLRDTVWVVKDVKGGALEVTRPDDRNFSMGWYPVLGVDASKFLDDLAAYREP